MANIPSYSTYQNQILYDDNLSQALVNAIGPNGFEVSQQTSANINSLSTTVPNGTIWYDTDNNVFKGLVNGVVKTFTLT